VAERKRTCGCEAVFKSVMCFALHIRHPQVQVPAFLTATCQVCTVALGAGLSTYNRFARRALYPPDDDPTQTDPDIVRMASQAPATTTGRLVCELKAKGEEKGEDAFDKRFAIAKQLIIGRFVLKVDGNGPVVAGLASGVTHGSSSGQMVGVADDPAWGNACPIARGWGRRRGATTKLGGM
jgi:hypothetical protein